MQSNLELLGLPDEQAVLDWLAEAPRTHGWDMWIAIDRSTVNRSLLLDYLERLDTHPLANSITTVAATQENLRWEHLYGLRFGPPELSFSESVVTSGRVGWSCRANAGVQLTVDQPGGASKRIVKIESYSPLQGPRLVARTTLKEISVAPQTAAKVLLDVAAGDGYLFGFAETEEAQRAGGDCLEKEFGSLAPGSHHAVISSVSNSGVDFLSPAEIRPRAFIAPGTEGQQGGGGVLLYVAFNGSKAGAFPGDGSDWLYPIPSGYSTAMVMSSYALMTNLVSNSLADGAVGAEFEYDNPDDNFMPVSTLTAVGGRLKSIEVSPAVEPFTDVSYSIDPDLADGAVGSANFHIDRVKDGLLFSWKTSSFSRAEAPKLRTASADAVSDADYALRVRANYGFAATDEGSIKLADRGGAPTWATSIYRQGGLLAAEHYQHFPALSVALGKGLVSAIDQALGGQSIVTPQFDLLRNAGLYFPGSLRLHGEAAHLPGELVVFGKVGSKVGSFQVHPSEYRVLGGGTVQFGVTPAHDGVEWSVALVDGFVGGSGTISATGEYTAPDSGSIEGSFTLVTITGSKGERKSSALVAVVKQDVVVNPLVFSTWPNGGETRVAGGCIDAGTLEWEVRSVTGATLEKPSMDGVTLFDANDRLYIPGPSTGDRFYSVDEIVARNPRTGESQATSALVIEKVLSAEIVAREGGTVPANQVQFDFRGSLGPIDGAEWAVAIGAGSIDNNGLYTMDPSSPHGFAVITASLSQPPVAELFNYLIVPIPLIDLKEMKRILV